MTFGEEKSSSNLETLGPLFGNGFDPGGWIQWNPAFEVIPPSWVQRPLVRTPLNRRARVQDGLHQHLTGNLFLMFMCLTVYLQNQIGGAFAKDSLQNFASVVNFFGRTGLTVWPFSTTQYVLWVPWSICVPCFGLLHGVAYHCSVLFLGVLGLSWVLPGVPHQRTWLRNGGKKEANKNRWWHDRFWPWQLCFVHLPQVFWPTLSSGFLWLLGGVFFEEQNLE